MDFEEWLILPVKEGDGPFGAGALQEHLCLSQSDANLCHYKDLQKRKPFPSHGRIVFAISKEAPGAGPHAE